MKPDHDAAKRHLTLLDDGREGGTFCVQTFDDNAQRKDGRLARTLHGKYDDLADLLTRLNQFGAGIYVTVNEVPNGKARTGNNVIRVRAQFADLDGAPIEPVLSCKPCPHFIVESSRGKFHAYWRVDGVPLDEFSTLQRKLAARFGSDPVVHDLPRVLRLAGFWHQKVSRDGLRSEPFQTIVREDLLNAR